MKPRGTAALLAALLAIAVAGCGGGFSSGEEDASDDGGSPKTVRAGALLTLTGALSDVGAQMKKTIDYATEEINRAGGIRSLDGARLEFTYGDSQTDPNAGVAETQRMIDGGVAAVIDQYPSAITIAASTVAERARTPYIASISYADAVTSRGYRYVFQQQVKARGIAEEKVAFLDHLNEVAGGRFKRIAVVYENTDYGTSIADNVTSQLKASGRYSVAAKVAYPATSPSFDGQAAKVRSARPDAVLLVPYLNDQILWFRTAKRFGLHDRPWIGNSLKLEGDFAKAVHGVPEGDLDRNIWSADLSDEAADLGRRFKEATGFELSGNYALMYQAVHTLKAALEKAGSAKRAKLRDALAGLRLSPGEDMIMPWKAIDFDDSGLNASGHGIVSQLVDGEWRTVWPDEYASTKLRVPAAWTGG